MRLYLDTADEAEWRALLPLGLFFGVTTNPLLTSRAGLLYHNIDWQGMVDRAAALGAQEFHAQIIGDEQYAVDFAKQLYQAGEASGITTVVKIPLTQLGIGLTRQIQDLGCKVLMTTCYSAKQMVIAQCLGAQYIAPYFGRMVEMGLDAQQQMRQIAAIRKCGSCVPLVASLRNTNQILQLTELGYDHFTISPVLAHNLMHDEISLQAAQEFEIAAKEVKT